MSEYKRLKVFENGLVRATIESSSYLRDEDWDEDMGSKIGIIRIDRNEGSGARVSDLGNKMLYRHELQILMQIVNYVQEQGGIHGRDTIIPKVFLTRAGKEAENAR